MYEGCTSVPASLPVRLIHNPQGERTCSAKWNDPILSCRFCAIQPGTFGQVEKCRALDVTLQRGGDDHLGWLVPDADCPLNELMT